MSAVKSDLILNKDYLGLEYFLVLVNKNYQVDHLLGNNNKYLRNKDILSMYRFLKTHCFLFCV